MILYWSDTRLTDVQVRPQATSMTIDPTRFSFDEGEPIGRFGRTFSGGNGTKIFADFTSVRFTISWDDLPRLLTIAGVTQTIEQWMLVWEKAEFQWIEGETIDGRKLNDGDPFPVMLVEAPIRRRLNDRDDQKEFEYALAGTEINVNG